jgi:hypothetical protein
MFGSFVQSSRSFRSRKDHRLVSQAGEIPFDRKSRRNRKDVPEMAAGFGDPVYYEIQTLRQGHKGHSNEIQKIALHLILVSSGLVQGKISHST